VTTLLEPPIARRVRMRPTGGTWVVLPTYNEVENLPIAVGRILEAVPEATILVVDDGSPDGTGALADELSELDDRITVRHRPAKEGLGRAYVDGFRIALDRGASVVCQLDADGSHDPAVLPGMLELIDAGDADLVIGSRYARGGRVVDWPLRRRVISRGGSLFARTVLGLRVNDLTGGYKAWRAQTLRAIDLDRIGAGGYVFQIETTFRTARAGYRIVEVPIAFRDRTLGESKMSGRIVTEALGVVLRLRADELRTRRVGVSGS
jgi:dolichol-phosphate mannosyltransferase